jgi:hypothetical protein
MFRMSGRWLTNINNNKVMDVQGGKDRENQNILVWKRHGGLNQQWDIIYANRWPKEPKKGELNKTYGIYVERSFYIISQMRSRRYLDLIGRNFVIKTANGRNTQVWYFDQRSKTIKSRSNNQSWDIRSAGKTNDMQVWSTNSGWW